MTKPFWSRSLFILPLVLALAAPPAHAAGQEAAKSAQVVLKDLELLDQDGRPVRFVTDVIADKIVVMDFIFTTCTTICPLLSSLMQQVQDRVGSRLEREVRLVSVTVDAARDTPRRLKAHSAKYKARQGWWWLTGPEQRVDSVLDGLGAYTPNFEEHPAMVLVGDGRTGQWSRLFGFPSPNRIMEHVEALERARRDATRG